MTAISTTALSIGASLTQLSSGDSAGSPTLGTTNTISDTPSTGGSGRGSGPAAYFTLSDQAKANLAASNRLDAYADAHRDSATLTGGETSTVASLLSLLDTSGQGTTTSGSNSGTATLQVPITDNDSSTFQTFTPTKNISKSVTYDGYTLTLNTDAGTQWYGIELSGNGIQAYDKHFGTSASAAGESGVTPGTEVGTGLPNSNNEAIDAITVIRNSATASSASVSSSAGATASTSSVSAQSSSITFLVNYATGQISVAQSATSVSAQSSQASSPGALVSTVA